VEEVTQEAAGAEVRDHIWDQDILQSVSSIFFSFSSALRLPKNIKTDATY